MRERIIPSTMIFLKTSLQDALRHIHDAGYDKAELCTVPGWVDHYDVVNAGPEKLAEAIRTVAASGVRIMAVNIGFGGWLDEDGMVRDGIDRTAKNALDLASALGAKVLTFGAGKIPPAGKHDIILKKIAGKNAEWCDLAAQRGIQLSIEAPHKKSIAESAEEIDAFWKDQVKELKVTLDPAHMVYAGLDPVAIAKKLACRCAHAHLRDAVPGNSLLKYGDGIMDFKAYILAINDAGFDGYFSMEFPTDSVEEGIERLANAKAFFEALYPEE